MEARAELAFLPRRLSRALHPLAAGGACADRLLAEACALEGSDSWRPTPQALGREIDALRATGTRLVLAGDENYPRLLRHISDPPICIHVRGRLPEPEKTCIAVVGSRASVGNSVSFTADLARELAAAGVPVVSGMARGIDAAAHRGCIEGGEATVAVLGCGADVCYPRENRRLMEEIADRGAVVSELPMGTKPAPFHFPARNRLISGLCAGTVVVEAGAGSGALVTARCALEQNRTVFAVPGAVWNPLSFGPNGLIRDGAVPARGACDVLEELLGLFPGPGYRPSPAAALDAGRQALLNALDYDLPRHVDAVANLAEIPVSRALPLLLDLEIMGVVRQLRGMRFVRAGKGA